VRCSTGDACTFCMRRMKMGTVENEIGEGERVCGLREKLYFYCLTLCAHSVYTHSANTNAFIKQGLINYVFEHCQENFEVASNAYKEVLEMAAMKKMLHSLPILYVHLFFVTIYMVRGLCKTNFPTLNLRFLGVSCLPVLY
jgi:hypothetical protein